MCDRQIQKKYVPVLCINLISDTALSNYIERDTLFTSYYLQGLINHFTSGMVVTIQHVR